MAGSRWRRQRADEGSAVVSTAPVMSPPEGAQRVLAGVAAGLGPGIADHLAFFGAMPRLVPRPGRPDPGPVRLVEASGLTGRGGAAFPVARKLDAVARDPGGVVIVNGCEGEPASSKDAYLLCCAPHLVLDGALAAAATVGASRVALVIDRQQGDTAAPLRQALAERAGDGLPIDVVGGPTHYVAGEATALVRLLNGGEAKPTFGRPPYRYGVGGRAALVQNAETLAHLALVLRYGAAWFRSQGTDAEPGTAVVTLGGGIPNPGVTEVSFGTSIGDVLAAGGATQSSTDAVLVGGYGGAWITGAEAGRTTYSNASLAGVGAAVGAGLLAVLPAGYCGIAETARIVRWLAGESAGQCGPCVHALPAIADALEALAMGAADRSDLARVQRWVEELPGRGACRHPDGAARVTASALRSFAGDIADHLAGRTCLGTGKAPLLPVPDHRTEPWR